MHMSYCLCLLIVYRLAAGATQNGSNRCILPPYPAYGTYTVHERPEAVPGETYGLAIITVTCDPGYEVLGNKATYCFSNNDWQNPMPRCTHHGLGIISVRNGSDSEFEPITVASSGTVRPNVEKEKASAAKRSDSEASVPAADVTITKVKNPDQNRKPSTPRSDSEVEPVAVASSGIVRPNVEKEKASAANRSDSEFEPVTVASSGTVRPNVEKEKASAANRSDSEASVAAVDVTITKVKNPGQNRKPSSPRSDSEFEPVTVASSGTVRPNVEKEKALAANRSDSEASVAAADAAITKVKNPDQNRKPSTPRPSAPKKKTKNPFDVFGLFPEEANKTDLIESSITTRVPNGTTKRSSTLEGDYFLELRVYNTAEIIGVLAQKRWKKAFITLRAQIDDETAEWEALQTFIKKISTLFEDADVKFYSNDTK